MSVLINGMKMPTSCLKGGCPLDGFACQLWEDKYWARVESPEKMRHKNCPLIELPDHGRLIDADALKENRWCDTTRYGDVEVVGIWHINDAPTVIPAERSEE